MLKNKRKNSNNIKNYNKFELRRKVNKFISINLLSNNTKKTLTFPNFSKTSKTKNYSKTKIKTFCNLTKTSKSVSSKYYLGRSSLREFLSFGIVPGYKKAVW
jgi:ribosomal protein S14